MMTDAPMTNSEGLISFLEKSPDFIEIKNSNLFSIDLKYATNDNFMNANAYGNFRRAYLHQVAFSKLEKSALFLQQNHPGFKFLIYDALRPRSAQRTLWKYVVGTPEQKYVADPEKGSIHNYGFAVDLTVLDEKGVPLDMGAGFDDFREISQPDQEQKYLLSGELSKKQHEHRLVLRKAMVFGGYRGIAHEWWHFEALPREEVRSHYRIIE